LIKKEKQKKIGKRKNKTKKKENGKNLKEKQSIILNVIFKINCFNNIKEFF